MTQKENCVKSGQETQIRQIINTVNDETDDEFTEDEKHKIDKKYNSMMKKINNGHFPFKKQLQEHFPDVEFW